VTFGETYGPFSLTAGLFDSYNIRDLCGNSDYEFAVIFLEVLEGDADIYSTNSTASEIGSDRLILPTSVCSVGEGSYNFGIVSGFPGTNQYKVQVLTSNDASVPPSPFDELETIHVLSLSSTAKACTMSYAGYCFFSINYTEPSKVVLSDLPFVTDYVLIYLSPDRTLPRQYDAPNDVLTFSTIFFTATGAHVSVLDIDDSVAMYVCGNVSRCSIYFSIHSELDYDGLAFNVSIVSQVTTFYAYHKSVPYSRGSGGIDQFALSGFCNDTRQTYAHVYIEVLYGSADVSVVGGPFFATHCRKLIGQ
jgi:hypothetical protein